MAHLSCFMPHPWSTMLSVSIPFRLLRKTFNKDINSYTCRLGSVEARAELLSLSTVMLCRGGLSAHCRMQGSVLALSVPPLPHRPRLRGDHQKCSQA